MGHGLDLYTFRARVIPFATVAVPPLVLLVAGIVTGTSLGIASGIVGAVATALAAQFGRDRGRSLQPALWESWGGSPTLQRLRYEGQSPERVRRLHARLEAVLGDAMPTADEEGADTAAADDRYDDACARIRARTHDRRRFPLLFAENVNYGMRRNLLGLKSVGIVVAIVTLVASGLLLGLTDGDLAARTHRFLPSAAASLLMLVFWTFVVSRRWVRLPADAYAEQFVATVEQLYAEQSANGAG
jgi:hypothetical protein